MQGQEQVSRSGAEFATGYRFFNMEMDYSVSAPFDLVIPPRVRTVAAGINPRRGRRQPLAATTRTGAYSQGICRILWRLRSPAMQRRRCPHKPPPLAEAKSEAAGCLTSKRYCPASAFLRIAGRAFASRWRGTAHVRANARRPGFDAARSIYRASCERATLSLQR